MARKIIAGTLIGTVAAGVVLALNLLLAGRSGTSLLQTVEMRTYDWRLAATARPSTARQDIALIEIDEYSLRNLQPFAGRWPWPRVVHAGLLDYLARAAPKVILYDVNFADPDTALGFPFAGSTWTGAESDAAFAEAVRKAGNVLTLADATYEGDADVPIIPDPGFAPGGPGITERRVVFPPYPDLAAAVAGFGHNLFVLDPDGPLRHTVPFVRSRGVSLPSLGLAGALRAAGISPEAVRMDARGLRLGDRVMPLDWREIRSAEGVTAYQWGLVNFRGPALLADLESRPYPRYAFYDLLYSEEQIASGAAPKIDPSAFRDKIVFVGVTGAGLFDVFETPFAGGRMPGIQVHAAVADDVLSGRFMTPAGGAARLATVVGGAMAVGLIAAVLPAWWASAVALLAAAVFTWATMRLFAAGYWLNLTQPILAMALALFGGVGYQYFVEGREKRKMKRLFGQYVSKDVYEQLVADPSRARLGGTRREMTVLFSDIRGFTTVSERGQPEEIVGMLNEYFTRMVDLVFAHKGTLDKFVGDMVMALFGAPLDDRDHADHAVACALDMVDELGRLNAGWRAEGRAELDIGIGINTGAMIAGNIGSEAIMSYTVIGDAVNLGARLESLNKQYASRIIISESTRAQLTGRYVIRPLGDVVVKGKTMPVAIFEVVGRAASGVEAGRVLSDAPEERGV
jgi:adenylate cyclase